MKDFIKTIILTIIVLLILITAIFIFSNVEEGIELLTHTNLPVNDPDVRLLYDKIENNHYLRKASININDLTDDELIKLVIDNLKTNDYTKKSIKAKKIVCEVTKKIRFNTDAKYCNIRIIKTSIFNKYIKENFDLDEVIEFKNFNYKGYNCLLDKDKYYCKYTSTKDYIQGYSTFSSAYKTKDTLVINEYYLQIDLSDGTRCNLYFDEEYCADYKEVKRKEIDQSIIKKDGVIYEHVFEYINGKYYLKKSYVKNEG